ncbi:hypothetical protein HDE_04399 [Halotydeus destructor]|nr:hypothetical protein HDE_04399 [Halotydeus destructor]
MMRHLVATVLLLLSLEVLGDKAGERERQLECDNSIKHSDPVLKRCGFCHIDKKERDWKRLEDNPAAHARCSIGCQLFKRIPHGVCISYTFSDSYSGDYCECITEERYARIQARDSGR